MRKRWSKDNPTNNLKNEPTIRMPLTRYIRVPIEVQIRPLTRNDEGAHEIYKRDQYMRVFPLWYPERIYRPILDPTIAVRKTREQYLAEQRRS